MPMKEVQMYTFKADRIDFNKQQGEYYIGIIQSQDTNKEIFINIDISKEQILKLKKQLEEIKEKSE